SDRWTIASTPDWSRPAMTSHMPPRPPNVIAPRQSSETNTPVSASCRYFIAVDYTGAPTSTSRPQRRNDQTHPSISWMGFRDLGVFARDASGRHQLIGSRMVTVVPTSFWL